MDLFLYSSLYITNRFASKQITPLINGKRYKNEFSISKSVSKTYNSINFDITLDILIILIAPGLISGIILMIIEQSLWEKSIRKCLEDMINFHSKDCLIISTQGIALDMKLKKASIAIKKDRRLIDVTNFDLKELGSEFVIETKQEKKVEKVKTSVGSRVAGGLLGGAIGATIGGIAGDKYNASYTIPAQIGTYTVRFIANDTNGNLNSTVTTFFVGNDVTNPVVTDLAPQNNSVFNTSTTIDLAANVTDSIAVSYVYANITLPNTI